MLPFRNLSGDPAQDYFCDGMVEDIATGLSRINWLFVSAPRSADAWRGVEVDSCEIGRMLVNLHGQHEAQTLLDADSQRQILDTFGAASVPEAAAMITSCSPRLLFPAT